MPSSPQTCLARLRQYKPTVAAGNKIAAWHLVPAARRAAVLVLLRPRGGALDVVLTLRAARLSSYSGQVAFPGGKADSETETPWNVARREANEEIGLFEDGARRGLRVDQLTTLPTYFARNWLAVLPCVAVLAADGGPDPAELALADFLALQHDDEVAAIFTAPLADFLHLRPESRGPDAASWYRGAWHDRGGVRMRMHTFRAPRSPADVVFRADQIPNDYMVWGMTSRILVDVARIAYDMEPEMEYTPTLGDEGLVTMLLRGGHLKERRKGEENVRFDALLDADALAKL
ncbi:NUDIX hydrolase domain-like protein [Dipodascopsis tothii]|uniref:NUDIX hydrolase domain-like protein n=1 Tax=Dipodascopsis tothii TaxID=44089 RepID=UPI0034CD2EDA